MNTFNTQPKYLHEEKNQTHGQTYRKKDEEPEIKILSHASKNMIPEEKARLVNMARILFPQNYPDEFELVDGKIKQR